MSVNIFSENKLHKIAGSNTNPSYYDGWDSNTLYTKNVVVKHNDCLWIALQDTSVEPTPDNLQYWKKCITDPDALGNKLNQEIRNAIPTTLSQLTDDLGDTPTHTHSQYITEQYVHPDTPGYKHIPSGGSTGQILQYESEGTAKWVDTHDSVITAIVNNGGNTVRYNYSDGAYDILETVDPSSYQLTRYNSDGTLIEVINTTETDGVINVTRS